MSSGFNHDKYNYLWSLPFALLCSLEMGWSGFIVGGGSFLIGGFWLSPDLDISSNPSRRWGPFKILWTPYRKLLRHRSILSHTFLLGTTSRLIYIATLLSLFLNLFSYAGFPLVNFDLFLSDNFVKTKIEIPLCAFIALEVSAWLHLLQDINLFKKIW
uniref:Metal-binding protein n=1 Tax=Paulinella longichromatophora TaxID=1708747 RepID=A0A2H4ZPE5_9EUKA|nr:hypothetical protein PLO_373 [Paulinella longichromatophora]